MSDSPLSAGADAGADAKRDATAGQIVMYSTRWCGDCGRARRIFAELGVAYQEIDVDRDPEAAERVRELNRGMRSVPTIVFPDGSILVEPGRRELEAKLRQLA
jgi:mycoredoxin